MHKILRFLHCIDVIDVNYVFKVVLAYRLVCNYENSIYGKICVVEK